MSGAFAFVAFSGRCGRCDSPSVLMQPERPCCTHVGLHAHVLAMLPEAKIHERQY